MKNRIITVSSELFLKYGYSRVPLDEIARELSMSKKTIYNYFGSKEELLYAIIQFSSDEFEEKIEMIENALGQSYEEHVMSILSVSGLFLTQLSVLINDLKNNFPEAYHKLMNIKKDMVLNHGVRILKKGIELGVVNEGWKTILGFYMFMATSEKAIMQSYRDTMPLELIVDFPDNPEKILHAIVDVLYHGIKVR
ncbi:MAG: TetR/AcrR family transcriptional regulator [Salinivirgaceae bacterium]|nr:TetR/AcrR family transcriptional regulator [Salinivirgaceae bacterium]MDY0282454.1 TetR/AcrR family transcriptional regulator [Salinivirgaceae bacterium]